MCDFSTIQIPLHLNHFCKSDPHSWCWCPFPEGGGSLLVCKCPQAPKDREIKGNVYLHSQRSSCPLPPPPAAGLRSRGDESDQSDQSTQITVIPEVRRRATGHSEFTQPTQALDKSVQEWQTCARLEWKSLLLISPPPQRFIYDFLFGFSHIFNHQPSRNGHIT